MRFFDFFSGIGGFRLGLERAGHVCVGASEVADFPRVVYEHRFGHAPAGDMTQLRPHDMPAADLWCGGWPCQGLSSAGLRKGIFGDPRSNLIWPLLDLADACEAHGNGPTWLLLENVPGLLTGKDYECGEGVHGGRPEDPCPACGRPLGDAAVGHVQRPWFGEVLGALAERGWVGTWRVLDAQFFGLAQHRERVFLLARRARAGGVDPAEVLLESGGVRGDPRARGAQGAEVAGTVTCRTGSRRGSHDASGAAAGHFVAGALVAGDGGADVTKRTLVPDVAGTVYGDRGSGRSEGSVGRGLVPDVARTLAASFDRSDDGTHNTLVAQHPFSVYPEHGQGADLRASPTDVSPALTVTDGRSERGVRVVAFDRAQVTHPENRSHCDPDAPAPALAAQNHLHVATYSVFSATGDAKQDHAKPTDVARTLDRTGGFAAGQGGTIVAGTVDDKAFALSARARNTAHGPDTYVIPLTSDAAQGRSGDALTPSPDAEGRVRLRPASLGVGVDGQSSYTVTAGQPPGVAHALGVRRLTPRECERLMGLPDDWTLVPDAVGPRGKIVATDTKRYESLGNSVAVPVIEWIGRRLKDIVK